MLDLWRSCHIMLFCLRFSQIYFAHNYPCDCSTDARQFSLNIEVKLIKYVFGWSINQVSGIFALESQLGEVPLIMRFILLLCTLANLGISSGQEWESSPIYYRRPYLLSSYYLLEIPQTNRFPCSFFVISLFCRVNYSCRLPSELSDLDAQRQILNRCLLLDPFCRGPLPW